MKRQIIVFTIFVVVVSLSFSNFLLANSREDYKVIKKAVKKGTVTQPRADEEVKWFKILVIDNFTKKNKVKVTLPISLIEIFLRGCKDSKFQLENECEIDIREIFQELKKLGPMTFIEVYEKDETVRIWLE
ncbi:MAG: hypothetical protein ACE5WD_03285 [Candidatus Aminicenantia bacterium]